MEQRPRSDSPIVTSAAVATANSKSAAASSATTAGDPENTAAPAGRRKKKSGNRKKPARRLVSYNDDTIVSDGDENDQNSDGSSSSSDDEGSDSDEAMDEAADANRDGSASMDTSEPGGVTGSPSGRSASNEANGTGQRDRAAEYGFSLPAEPRGRCPAELQDKIAHMHAKMRAGMDMNRLIQDRKEFRNPSIYEKLIQFCDINELGTNYPPEIYDPLQWGRESFYEELAGAQKVEMERRERERKDGLKHQLVVEAARKAEEEAKRRKSKWDQPAPSGGPAPAGVQVVGSAGTATSAAASAVAAATALQVAKAAGAAAVAAAAAAAAAGLVQPNATGTKGTVISAFGSLPKKPKA